jgi:translation elongation factor EF-Tu-like GTPase
VSAELQPSLKAELKFLATEDGGRKTPVSSGYRPQFYYAGKDWDAAHSYDIDWVYPGDTVLVTLAFFRTQNHVGQLYSGMPFAIREGPRTVANGHILKVLDPTLDRDA